MPTPPLNDTSLPRTVTPRDVVILIPPAAWNGSNPALLLPSTASRSATTPSESWTWRPRWPLSTIRLSRTTTSRPISDNPDPCVVADVEIAEDEVVGVAAHGRHVTPRGGVAADRDVRQLGAVGAVEVEREGPHGGDDRCPGGVVGEPQPLAVTIVEERSGRQLVAAQHLAERTAVDEQLVGVACHRVGTDVGAGVDFRLGEERGRERAVTRGDQPSTSIAPSRTGRLSRRTDDADALAGDRHGLAVRPRAHLDQRAVRRDLDRTGDRAQRSLRRPRVGVVTVARRRPTSATTTRPRRSRPPVARWRARPAPSRRRSPPSPVVDSPASSL